MKADFSPFPNLTTKRLLLRRIELSDMETYYILKSDERLLAGYDAKPKTYEQAKAFLTLNNEGIEQRKWLIWGIALQSNNQLIGSICFWKFDLENDKAEIGYELLNEWQGKGIMLEAAKAVISYGFQNMKLKTITACPNPNHVKSVKLLERCGFLRGEIFDECHPGDSTIFKRVAYTLLGG